MSLPGSNDTEFQASADTPNSEKAPISDDVIVVNDDEDVIVNEATGTFQEENNDEGNAHHTKKKRKKSSPIWVHFSSKTIADGSEVHECIHCGEKIKELKEGTTTPLHRHINQHCPKVSAIQKGQLKLNVSSGKASGSSSMVQNWKFSNVRMREVISHMIMVNELPFNFVEYELFNVVMKEANPEFEKISRASVRQDCISSYDLGKKRIQKLLNTVDRVSITTDMWTSLQNIHYMVLTCHFVDSNFELHKRILSFVDVPPPGVNIYDCLFKCLKDWNIEMKVASSFLSLFNEATKIILGSEYPTSNLFLIELYVIKEALDIVALDENDCMKAMAAKMKEKFDKYLGSTNLLISIAAVMDPRYKMELINLSFKTIYTPDKASDESKVIRVTLEDMFKEYVEAHKETNVVQSSSATIRSGSEIGAKYAQHIKSVDIVERVKSELATYLDEGVYICETGANFDALGWWKENRFKYRILSKMAVDILSIPITTVASESAFSAGGRVIEPHH